MARALLRAKLASAALVLAVLAGCGNSSQQGVLRIGYTTFPDFLDPQLSRSLEGWTAMWNSYIPLLTYSHAQGGRGGILIPGLAKALPKITDGGKTYTLWLRRGLRYSTGQRVQASDFEYAVMRMLALNSGGSSFYTDIVGAPHFQRHKHGDISGIICVNKTGKIVIRLNRPRGTFSNELGLMYVAPIPPTTPAKNQTPTPPPATGPYAITRVDPGHSWVEQRNPVWLKGNATLMPQIPGGNVGRIDVRINSNTSAQATDVERGALDWMFETPPPSRYQEIKRKYGDQLKIEPTISTYYFWMNSRRPPFNDVRVRRAVNYALDPEALVRIYAGQIKPTQQILPPAMPGYRHFVLYPHNLARARRLLRRAKPRDRDITVWTDDEHPNDNVGAYYQDVLRQLGFDAHLKVIDSQVYFATIGNSRTPNLDTGWTDWFEDYPHPSDFFQLPLDGESIQATNNANLSQTDIPGLNRRIDQLATRKLGPVQKQAYAALDKAFMRQAVWAPYGNRTLPVFVSSRVDLGQIVWNPTFGVDLTSFHFR